MLKLGAKIISFVFHPLLMPTWLFAILMFFSPAIIQLPQFGYYILILIFGMTFFLPFLNLLLFKMTGTIADFYMNSRQERLMPSILITLVYAGIAFMFYWKVYPIPVFFKLMTVITLLSATVTTATFFFKISAHAVGMCGLAGILLAIATLGSASGLILPALVAIVLAGATMSSRLLLNAHSLNEVSWGGALGFAVGFCGVLIIF